MSGYDWGGYMLIWAWERHITLWAVEARICTLALGTRERAGGDGDGSQGQRPEGGGKVRRVPERVAPRRRVRAGGVGGNDKCGLLRGLICARPFHSGAPPVGGFRVP